MCRPDFDIHTLLLLIGATILVDFHTTCLVRHRYFIFTFVVHVVIIQTTEEVPLGQNVFGLMTALCNQCFGFSYCGYNFHVLLDVDVM